ncbi:hypothetical protein O6P43_030687 [Quillaja saponaria]|uniref:Uncharacterized protein n=1 Tax=Quillaja saponaria TaxID=32244 RepID=A0AAD7P8H1_QUISA|nr:hypothetical protein O6P43_030687 [Quillaja saponaria]KAJ7945661.1 hypothetical protein O6P43_030687 [Quillaja saponaria]
MENGNVRNDSADQCKTFYSSSLSFIAAASVCFSHLSPSEIILVFPFLCEFPFLCKIQLKMTDFARVHKGAPRIFMLV